jgi:uncharacterized protein YegP (UPF0339 family)
VDKPAYISIYVAALVVSGGVGAYLRGRGDNLLLKLLILIRDWKTDRRCAELAVRREKLAVERDKLLNAVLREHLSAGPDRHPVTEVTGARKPTFLSGVLSQPGDDTPHTLRTSGTRRADTDHDGEANGLAAYVCGEEVNHVRFEITKSTADDKYRFRIWSSSDILASSQGYVSKQSAKNAIASIKRNAASADVIDNA